MVHKRQKYDEFTSTVWTVSMRQTERRSLQFFRPCLELKNKLPSSTTSFRVYSVTCSCRTRYTGRTTRRSSDRLSEHHPGLFDNYQRNVLTPCRVNSLSERDKQQTLKNCQIPHVKHSRMYPFVQPTSVSSETIGSDSQTSLAHSSSSNKWFTTWLCNNLVSHTCTSAYS